MAVINSENISRSEADEFTEKSLHGLMDEILQKKTPITLEDILKPGKNGRPVQRVLVEGAPGVGKSTFAWQLCYRWVQRLDNLKHFDLVVLVQLRGKRAQEAKNLSDLFPLSEKDNIEHVLAAIGHGEGVLIILDGFDELPREQRQEGSIYMNLVKRVVLPNATVITTSRPSVSAYIIKKYSKHVHRRLEILGFTEKKVEEYASKFEFHDPTCHTKFLEYINGNPVIKGMMYLPLNAFFVASIFEYNCQTNSSPNPKTMTQLYDTLIRNLIRRHLAVPDDHSMPKSLMHRDDINSLPRAEANQLLELARIAYEGLCDEKYVFTDIDGSKFNHLGMMKKTTSLDDTSSPTYTFSFLHLTLQEYLSALHLSIGQHTAGPDIPHLVQRDIVLRFLAGLCKHSTNFSCQQVGDVLAHVSTPYCYGYENPCIPAQVVRCVYESDSIVQESWEMQNMFAIDSNKTVTAELLSQFDSYLIGHYISCHVGVWFVKTNHLGLFVEGLKSCSGDEKGMLKILNIRDTELITLDPVLLSVESISFDEVTFSASSVSVLQQYISSNGNLKELTVYFCEHVELLLPIIFEPSSLEVINLGPQSLIDNHTIISFLMNNSNVKELQVTFAVQLPISTLCDNTSLKYLANHIHNFLDLAKWNLTIQKIKVVLTYIHRYSKILALLTYIRRYFEKTHDSKLIADVGYYELCPFNTTQQLLLHIPEQYYNYIHLHHIIA